MTERTKKPTNAEIHAAITNLAHAYHEFVQVLMAREEDERHERQQIRERLDSIYGIVDRMQKQVDRRFDQVWNAVDALTQRVSALEAQRPEADDAERD